MSCKSCIWYVAIITYIYNMYIYCIYIYTVYIYTHVYIYIHVVPSSGHGIWWYKVYGHPSHIGNLCIMGISIHIHGFMTILQYIYIYKITININNIEFTRIGRSGGLCVIAAKCWRKNIIIRFSIMAQDMHILQKMYNILIYRQVISCIAATLNCDFSCRPPELKDRQAKTS